MNLLIFFSLSAISSVTLTLSSNPKLLVMAVAIAMIANGHTEIQWSGEGEIPFQLKIVHATGWSESCLLSPFFSYCNEGQEMITLAESM